MLPKDPNYRERVTSSFDRQKVMKHLGIALFDVQPGSVVLTMPHADHLTQQHGFMHAGIMATALDSACGYAAFSLMPPEAAVLTVEYKINLVAPASGDSYSFRAAVVKPGRSITVCDGRAFAVRGENQVLIATMTGTLMALYDRPGITQ